MCERLADKVISAPMIPGWRTFRSDGGRLWASREEPFSAEAEKAGAFRTVDGKDDYELRTAVKDAEQRAAEAC